MIEKELGKEYSLEEREQFLSNTCDGTEEVSYSRVFTPEELAKQRELLTEASIKLADIDEAKKEAMAEFKEQAKPYTEQRQKAIDALRTKAETVTEVCYKYEDDLQVVLQQGWQPREQPPGFSQRNAKDHVSGHAQGWNK